MRKHKGAAFKSGYRYKRVLRHYGKRKVTKTVEVPYYVVTATTESIKQVSYSLISP